jgi:tRNA-specific 2-thiouridylase
MTKPEIRAIARELGLRVADKADSQEICFVPGNDYKAFLKSHLGEDKFHRGGIYDTSGNFLGEHEGIEMFTIGQRKGLPGGSPKPMYVVDIDAASSRVIVGGEDELLRDEFEVDRVNWIAGEPDQPVEATVKIRYAHPGAAAVIRPLAGGRAHIALHEPQRSITPGQASVFYQDDLALGGGWIVRKNTPLISPVPALVH